MTYIKVVERSPMVQNALWPVGNMGIFSAESEVVGVPKSCGNAAPLRTLSWWACAWVRGCVALWVWAWVPV